MRVTPLILLVACQTAEDPHIEDSDSGTPVAQVSPCGEDDTTNYQPDARLLRWPYLTDVTPTSAVVQWAAATGVSTSLEWGATAEFGSTAEADVSQVDALVDPIALHAVRLTELTPNSFYCFRVMAGDDDLSGPLVLRTAPKPDSQAPVRWLVIGDYGNSTPNALAVYDQVKQHYGEFDFWLTTGDNAYGDGTYAEWETHVFQFYRDLMRRVPFFPVPGNHDYRAGDLKPMLSNLVLPANAYREEDMERYYSFDWGPLHIVAADSQVAVYQLTPEPGDDMMDWLRDDLAANQDRPWRIGTWHHPAYATQPDRIPELGTLIQLLPAAEAGNIDLVLNGHNHAYERFSHIRDGQKLSSGGTTHVISGAGGAGPSLVSEDGSDHPNIPLRDKGASKNHFMLFEATRCTLTGRAIDTEGEVFDTFTLERC